MPFFSLLFLMVVHTRVFPRLAPSMCIASNSDFLIALFVSAVIGQSKFFGLVLRRSNENYS